MCTYTAWCCSCSKSNQKGWFTCTCTLAHHLLETFIIIPVHCCGHKKQIQKKQTLYYNTFVFRFNFFISDRRKNSTAVIESKRNQIWKETRIVLFDSPSSSPYLHTHIPNFIWYKLAKSFCQSHKVSPILRQSNINITKLIEQIILMWYSINQNWSFWLFSMFPGIFHIFHKSW